MANAVVHFDQATGPVKPMHATNNGPAFYIGKMKETGASGNLELFKNAGIPYARTHDASYYYIYGSEHTVDIAAIFPHFDADENDPANYDFACTDHYLECCMMAGCKPFYRLGHRIEHEVKKYGTLPPKDFHKWARICEHIILHYNEGWANGFHYDLEYWEIWNEPDLDPDDSANKRCWGGTRKEFFEFYHIAATYLKERFPHLKIGGPAIAGDMVWAEEFLAQLKAPLDFFSWHRYACLIEKMTTRVQEVRNLLDKYGFEKTESILNEWNYVLAWHGDEMTYSHKAHHSIKGAAFTLSAMAACQNEPLDMLMYYDARPTFSWNGMFDVYRNDIPLKGYYPFPMFNELYKLGEAVQVKGDENIYLAAAKKDDEAAVVLTHYNNDDETAPKALTLNLLSFGGEMGTVAEVYLLDETHDMEKVHTFTYFGDQFIWETEIPNNTCYLIKLKKK
ncbi:MAG: hypothetical protein IJN80_03110 [Clostridia bacterium]|nr:hypothetical protein [Clostridia bacterium]